MKKYFDVDISAYATGQTGHGFHVYYPSSLTNPKDYAVSFITESHISRANAFLRCHNNLIFWPEDNMIPNCLLKQGHVIVQCKDPHLRFCQFFDENNICNLPKNEKGNYINHSFIAEDASISDETIVFPGAYIGGEVEIGRYCYIGSGVRIIGKANIGDYVVIRENTVIGADGLTTDRDETGRIVKMPQFGGVTIGNHVTIGANCVIARGAIDDTIIGDETSIDNCTFISHNVQIGKRVLVVGETIMFGSSSVGDNTLISGNSTIRNGISIGCDSVVGMGSVVVHNVPDKRIVKGNPAK